MSYTEALKLFPCILLFSFNFTLSFLIGPEGHFRVRSCPSTSYSAAAFAWRWEAAQSCPGCCALTRPAEPVSAAQRPHSAVGVRPSSAFPPQVSPALIFQASRKVSLTRSREKSLRCFCWDYVNFVSQQNAVFTVC